MMLHGLVWYVVTTTTEQYSASILYPKMVENLSSPFTFFFFSDE